LSVKECDEKKEKKSDNKNWYPVKKEKRREDSVEANSNKKSALDPPA